MIEKITDGRKQSEDNQFEIRPQSYSNFVGQELIKENFRVYIAAALKRGEPLDHILISGPPGLGKTTFSMIIAREMKSNLKATTAPAIEKNGDMAAILSGIKRNDILFIDEIHRLKPTIEEMLYGAMEDFHLDISLGQGATGKMVRIKLPHFTLIGATTKAGALSQPLINRFGITGRFEFYTIGELVKIIAHNAGLLHIKLNPSGMNEIAKRSRGTPRILNRLLKRVRDYAEVRDVSVITKELVDYSLKKMNIDDLGLDRMDREILKSLIVNFKGGPVGLENLATTVGEDTSTIEEMYEPFLIQIGLLKRTSRGRVATEKAFKYINVDVEENLFNRPPH